MTLKFRVFVDEDGSGSDPTQWGVWKIISFRSRHCDLRKEGFSSVEDCVSYYEDHLNNNRALFLDHFDHSGSRWDLHGEGPGCRWDTCKSCGLIIYLEKEYPFETREKFIEAARAFLEEYNQWCAGEVYGWMTVDEDGEEIDACWGIIGLEWLTDCIRDHAGTLPFEVETSWEETVVRRSELGQDVRELIERQDKKVKAA